MDQAGDEPEDEEDQDIEENFGYGDDGPDQDDMYRHQENDLNNEKNDPQNLNSALLHGMIDPNEWKIELERVAPKLKSLQFRANSEWRNHIVQVVDSTTSIEKVVSNTKSDIAATMRYI